MDVVIRKAAAGDVQGIVDLLNSIIEEGGLVAIYPPLTVEQGEALMRRLSSRAVALVAEVDGVVVGLQTVEPYVPGQRALEHVATMSTFVYKPFRRKGLGRRLWENGVRFAQEQGYEKVLLTVRESNLGALTFFQKMGCQPRTILDRQVRIGNTYDNEILMEFFVPSPAKAVAPAVKPAEKGEPVAAAPSQAAPAKAKPAAPSQEVGAVVVRRAKRHDLKLLTAIMRGSIRWRKPPSEQDVLEMLFDKGYWIAVSRQGGGVTGWRAENLVMCIDDFYVYPPSTYEQVGGPLLETVETEARALACEVAIVFMEEQVDPQAIAFFESKGYERQTLQDLNKLWREVAEEFLTEGRFMMVKRLREQMVMRPL